MSIDLEENLDGFSDRLREIITLNGISQKQFAAICEMTEPTISGVLNEGRPPSLKIILGALKLPKKFDIEWLLTGKMGIQDCSFKEQQVIFEYRKLLPEQQQLMHLMLSNMNKQNDRLYRMEEDLGAYKTLLNYCQPYLEQLTKQPDESNSQDKTEG